MSMIEIITSAQFLMILSMSVIGIVLFYFLLKSFRKVHLAYMVLLAFAMLISIRGLSNPTERLMLVESILGLVPGFFLLTILRLTIKESKDDKSRVISDIRVSYLRLKKGRRVLYLLLLVLLITILILVAFLENPFKKYTLIAIVSIVILSNLYLIFRDNLTNNELLVIYDGLSIKTVELNKYYLYKFKQKTSLYSTLIIETCGKKERSIHYLVNTQLPDAKEPASRLGYEGVIESFYKEQRKSFLIKMTNDEIASTTKIR